jgi:antitoxin (DNA-binding transcriptional repressor) of toxin-antitoxin stability system
MMTVMATIHISEADATTDFAGVMDRIREGAEVVIESGNNPVAIVSPPEIRHRSISESLSVARARNEQRGYAAVADDNFAADMQDIIQSRQPADRSAWD